ncbi:MULTISPECIES: helix-turn-helix domain-containing protein [unclassified Mesorhizobium]|jgi:CRP/FNR family nitrogen fixation transcriptional regulator|uniref:helix-turn-helix domain-containing protein n=1 Tax=unclassified Mesorhizobium TaxID=325217 RepID=UPI000FE3313F|nr:MULTISPECIES: helix-turn-helix domain-containing protein [unclassified Mesorhizobium]MDG4892265.1 helix-turn-helix domain-containing protein [Mesorhizobium sp. WSM4976]RWH69463.1 MAG: cyclic nucleotide-binding domain-containing protein [Mesorhizobium sp.]RWL27951.1 MAG: cyclic nucleotide-binding domain-containing protein [Mesorhizobium sp.]RWL29259.1 MAG: cyclic nucleotide-binding domain-containing protein [Mesorhizobium sp.]RWL37316.1 MAG: cyclic nucleotide-binding domain-containing protei
MYAQASAKIALPSYLPHQSPAPVFEGQATPVSFFTAGAEIYAQGEKAGALYQVEFGAVRIYRLLADGRRQISAFHLAGETFGFEADATHHFFAEAINATGVRVFRAPSGTDMSRQLLPLALKGLTRAQEHLLVLGRQNAIERVAAFLVEMSERQGGLRQVELPMSRNDIGDYLGLTIETVSRVFTRLKEKGVIRLLSLRSIEILKRDSLLAMGE